ncbi:MAG: 2,3-bisphosphoglycerate-independent phosphoglycerate mutase [Saprospiraceae bacterium]
MSDSKRAFLLILDGWGIGPKREADAIAQADTPFWDSLIKKYPHSTLTTFGEAVGLPEGQMGNSEVGHLNIGAGRIVWQELARINKEIREKKMEQNQVLLKALEYARAKNKSVHFLGLVSDGGVHSHINHLKAICDIATEQGNNKVFVHAFTDGRDCDPKSGYGFIQDLLKHIEDSPVELASITGRYYAMDRDKRWERVQLAYNCLVHAQATPSKDLLKSIQESYEANVTDEFIKPVFREDLIDQATIQEGDVVLCFNFRTDRLRELTTVLTQETMHEYNMHTIPLRYLTMTKYDDSYKGVEVMYEKEDVQMTMGEVLEKAGKTQVRIAETEKYPHVTFFFSGGREAEFEGERRIMIPSPKVATYDLQPEMSAFGITEAIMQDIRNHEPDFICLNFANTDMVGHTGVLEAAIKAAETVDHCLSQIVPLAMHHGYQMVLIADHGNSDYIVNEDGSPNTAHTMNPVPCMLVGKDIDQNTKLTTGALADVAPTMLHLMDIPQPKEMTGRSLIGG